MTDDKLVPTGTFTDDHDVTRCVWCRSTSAYQHYHDHEWGFPVNDDRRLFEKVCLEGFQAGLSWLTILNKREAFRLAFAGFDMNQVATFGEAESKRLVLDAGIVRHSGKIASTINNAQRAQALRSEFGSLAAYFWQFEPQPTTRPERLTYQSLSGLTTSAESIALSKDLRKRGWSFVGPTTMYAFMQAMGLVNDHLEGCTARQRALQARTDFSSPARDSNA
ncbi:DNA-3-methyladenine glycosylase I [Candidatus Aalborgicola defluviihabitans]|jgi:DNA-3-methyladenine glycosylase I|uniref:DNA-3-methyladenine glycosylase I n=1 Tax=Candidatus Aalborgicola defluviihabitans TaxID=3386187 RepID=UPI001DC5840E|nr:DNA-3-methyladenine glycosylase I [Burkholderiales bacterium]MBK7281891.1 DNA-3-methyladenine glycosylase I [Burkholderiales bacterium]MBK7315152.1 DNA-3-methyladenine glycosylase I [Burkholderiales bacterium]MBL0242600.1 DNA-3-methyladenine glycosylase I [Rhodoferax sp.]